MGVKLKVVNLGMKLIKQISKIIPSLNGFAYSLYI
ncbi:hypothetical protein BH23BAC3_BH23BAC3_32710 [soil metagenome]